MFRIRLKSRLLALPQAGGRNTGATQLTYVRVYQGGVKRGDTLYNIRTNKRARVSKLVRMHSNKAEVR